MLALVAGVMVALALVELLPSCLETLKPDHAACSCGGAPLDPRRRRLENSASIAEDGVHSSPRCIAGMAFMFGSKLGADKLVTVFEAL